MKKIQIIFGNLVIIASIFLPLNIFFKNDLLSFLLSFFINLLLIKITPGPSQDYPFSFSVGLSFLDRSE